MYEQFYGLRERPFALSPDPDYLYLSPVHRAALDYLRFALVSQAGFVAVTGEIGSGKTTLLHTLLRNLDARTSVGRVVNTLLEPRELLETIMLEFNLDPAGKSKPLMLRDLVQYLVDQRLAGRVVLLVVDEAQNLSKAALEELRMLSNLGTEKSNLLQIALVGQPNLRDTLAAPELEQLRQRISVSYHLPPLDADETEKYINHRLRLAAIGAPLEFPRPATDAIYERSRGVPRIVNVICDTTLVFGYAEDRPQVDLALVREVLGELESTGVLPPIGFLNMIESPRTNPRPGAILAPTAPSPSVSPASMAGQDATLRAAQLDERERALRKGERELLEQRRIFAEEYRLLRASASGAAVDSRHGRTPATPMRAQSPLATTSRLESLWRRVKRALPGASSPAVD